MATITLTIPTEDVADVQAALCAERRLFPVNATNAKAALVAILKEKTRDYRVRVAQLAVATQAEPDVT